MRGVGKCIIERSLKIKALSYMGLTLRESHIYIYIYIYIYSRGDVDIGRIVVCRDREFPV